MTDKTTLNAEEVFEMAEQVERNGARFYRRAAERFKAARQVHDLLIQLATMEEDHERTFIRLRGELLGRGEWVDNDQMAASYLHALVEHKFFDPSGDVAAIIDAADTVIDVFEAAVRLEMATIVFYSGIREGMSTEFGHQHIDPIIREEMHHVTLLTNELSKSKGEQS